jgi:hemolysin activation/secretion protein
MGGRDVKLSRRTSAAVGMAALAAGMGAAAVAEAAPIPPTAPTSAFERNPAPGERPAQGQSVAPAPPKESDDATPLGADLSGLILIGAKDSPATGSSFKGVDVTLVDGLPHPERLQLRLKRFVGRPLSKKLISEVQADIVRHYRRAGRPFVSVTPPPQDVTDGVLRMRVVEFHLGKASVEGAKPGSTDYVLSQVRATPGERIDAAKLSEDLDWLNHDPFRNVTAVFSPGQELGATDMRVEVQDSKRWTVFAGYDNSGAPSGGVDRFMVGAQVGDLLVRDSLLSVQITTSSDYWTGHSDKYADAAHPKYLTDSVVWAMPIAPRQDFTLSADYVESNNPIAYGLFNVISRTEEASATYRTAVSNFLPVVAGDFSLGVETLGQQRATYLTPSWGGGLQAYLTIDVAKVFVGWSQTWTGLYGRQSLSITGHVSPGSLFDRNRDSDYAYFTQSLFGPPRMPHADYAYATLDYTGEFRLPRDWRYVSQVHAQITDSPLLDVEQMPVGGPTGARGYSLDDGSFDQGIIWRNELRTRTRSLFGTFSKKLPDVVSPYAFVDLGHLADDRAGFHQAANDAGVGADYALGHFNGGVSAAWAFDNLHAQPGLLSTPEGHFRLFARAQVKF